ncbi:MAG: response regulator [Elusimicrobiota bacterium]
MNADYDMFRASRPKKVLIVDDDKDLLEVYQDALRRLDFAVEICADGYAALRRMEETLFDVVVLDLMMPNCTGFEVLLQLQRKEGPKPAVIVITGAHKDPDTVERIRREPVVFDFLFKPCRLMVLADTIRRAVPAQLPGCPTS